MYPKKIFMEVSIRIFTTSKILSRWSLLFFCGGAANRSLTCPKATGITICFTLLAFFFKSFDYFKDCSPSFARWRLRQLICQRQRELNLAWIKGSSSVSTLFLDSFHFSFTNISSRSIWAFYSYNYIPRAVNLVNSTAEYLYDIRTQTYLQTKFTFKLFNVR